MDLLGKHVLMIVENLSVPFDRRVWREARALREAGAEVSVICPKGKAYDNESRSEIDGIKIYRYNLPLEAVASNGNFSKLSFIREYFSALLKTFFLSLRIYSQRRFHAIHVANPPDIFFLVGWFYKFLGVRFVFDHHDVCPEGYLDKKDRPTHDFLYYAQVVLERLSFLTADVVIATNESYKEIAIRRGKKRPQNVFVVRNGPDENSWKDIANRDEDKMGFRYLVGYIGVMAKLDGVDLLVRAADYVVNTAKRNDVGFVLIGSGTSYDELQELATSLGLGDNVLFTGRVSDERVFEILSSIDIGISPDPPSLLNNVSTMNKVMDYMWFGKPIVSFDLAESRYSAQDAAVYVSEVSYSALGRAILNLIENSEKMREMGSAGKRRVTQLTWQHSKRNLFSAYANIWPLT